jgi:uncharacterized protein
VTDRISRALVTGASAGLGAAFARRLAERGVELVLVARRDERLQSLADGLPVPAEVLTADLGDPLALGRVAERVASATAPVDLVVNNAGLGSYGPLMTSEEAAVRSMLEVNVAALTALTRAALPQLSQRGVGGIINVGSTAGYRPCPQAAVYGATKAYVRSFTEAVHEEARGSGVHVMLLAPGSTDTEFQSVAGLYSGRVATTMRAPADQVATTALRAFALRQAVCVPGMASRVAVAGARALPSRVTRRLSSLAMRRMVMG